MKLREANRMTDAELAEVLDFADVISGFVKSVRAEAFKRACQKNDAIPGYKLVEGKQGDRQWVTPEEVPQTLVALGVEYDKLFSRSLVTPAQAEALLKTLYKGRGHKETWNKFNKLIKRQPGQLSLSRDSDGREEKRRGHEFKAYIDKTDTTEVDSLL